MTGFSKEFKDTIMSVSYQERRKKKLARYREERGRFQKMEDDELHFEYVSLCSEYKRRRCGIGISVFLIAVGVFRDRWQYLYYAVERSVRYADAAWVSEPEAVEALLAGMVLIGVCLAAAVFWILADQTKRMWECSRKMMLIEEVRKSRSTGG